VRTQGPQQLARSGEGREVWEVAFPEDLPPPAADGLALRALGRQPRGRGEELVAAHPDQRTDTLERHRVAGLGQRLDPGPGVGVVAVDQGPVHVEDDAFDRSDETSLLLELDIVHGVTSSLSAHRGGTLLFRVSKRHAAPAEPRFSGAGLARARRAVEHWWWGRAVP
jgi:hypothetical protein